MGKTVLLPGLCLLLCTFVREGFGLEPFKVGGGTQNRIPTVLNDETSLFGAPIVYPKASGNSSAPTIPVGDIITDSILRRGIQGGVLYEDSTGPEYHYKYYDEYGTQSPWFYNRDELPDPEEEKILKMELLKTLVEDVEEAATAVASEIASEPRMRIVFGKLGHMKPIKFPSSWHKPHKPHKPNKPQIPEVPHKESSTDINVDIDAEIVVPPPVQSSENEE